MSLLFALSVKANFKANLFFFLGMGRYQFFGFGPKALPPPTRRGVRRFPGLAFPVPFCRNNFFELQLASPRVCTEEVPCL